MASKKPNVPDILIGVALVLILPLLAFALAGGSGSQAKSITADGKVDPPLTRLEAVMMRDEYARMYNQNVMYFLRMAEALPQQKDQQLGWARSVLQRSRQGLADLKEKLSSGKADADAVELLPEVIALLQKVEATGKSLE